MPDSAIRDRTPLWQRFTARAVELSSDVHVLETASALDRLLARLNPAAATATAHTLKTGVSLPAGSDSGAPDTVLARGWFAVAETGSVLLVEPQADRRMCLLADHLVLLVRESDLVPSLDEATARVVDLVRGGQRYATLVSGPSRTADIERVLTLGVHGPSRLTVLVLADTVAAT